MRAWTPKEHYDHCRFVGGLFVGAGVAFSFSGPLFWRMASGCAMFFLGGAFGYWLAKRVRLELLATDPAAAAELTSRPAKRWHIGLGVVYVVAGLLAGAWSLATGSEFGPGPIVFAAVIAGYLVKEVQRMRAVPRAQPERGKKDAMPPRT